MAEQTEIETLRAELRLRERQIEAIRRVSQALFAHSARGDKGIDDMLCRILSSAIEVLEADVGSIQLYDEATDSLVFRCVLDPHAERLQDQSYPATQGIGGAVFQSGQGRITHRALEQDGFNRSIDELTGYHTESLLTVPLRRLDEIRDDGSAPKACLGVMQVLNARHRFNEGDLAVLETLGAQSATAIETVRMSAEARRAELVNVIGDIAHDIKNMLTPMESGALTLHSLVEDALQEIPAKGHAAEMLEENYGWILEGAVESALRVQTRTRELADAIKGELAPPNFEEGNVNQVVHHVLRALRPVAETKDIVLRDACGEEALQACFDHKQLFNALYNLVNNAIPETPAGGEICVETRADEENFWLHVRDTGCGMEPEVRAKLFSDAAISTKPGGTGLGTRIVAGVVARHGGTIEVKSDVGEGTEFILRLPRTQAPKGCDQLQQEIRDRAKLSS
jgi:signal transduction histidine kinase